MTLKTLGSLLLLPCSLLAVSCVTAPVPTCTLSAKQAALDNIMNRTSVRSYTSERVSLSQVDTLLRAAMAAPTARNGQPWAFVVIDQRSLLDSLGDAMPHGAMLNLASVAVVVCGDTNKAIPDINNHNYWEQDCSAATENLLLAASAIGLGAVWIGVFPNVDRQNDVRQIINLPNNLIPLNIISIGYPDTPLNPKEKFRSENIFFNRF